MKFKYVIIFIVTVFVIGACFWQNVSSEEKQIQVEQVPHTSEEEKEHDTHDHDEHEKVSTKKVEEHDVHDEHAEEEGEESHDEDIVRLTDAELKEFAIVLSTVHPGAFNQYIEVPGEIALNADRMAHVVPRVAGIVKDVRATVGDQVEKGQLLAVLESRELADAKASYLAAIEKERVAQTSFKREERLWGKKVTSEQEYLDARQALAEARIVKKSAEQQLHALGCNENELRSLTSGNQASFTHYAIKAPFAGTVIEKHITSGEGISAEADIFTIVDLSTVWVNINIYQKDLPNIRKGQTVEIEIGAGIPSVKGEIAWVGPQVDAATRTVKARIELPNPDGNLRPGLFVTANIAIENSSTGIVVPKGALQTFENKTVIFVQTDKGFEPVPVEIGQQNNESVEILSGLALGQKYVSQGAFTLKAQLSKSAFGDGHNH